ncbi:MAG: hypothetical protein MJH10_21255, partial [Epibacterium sp.]|nr:hypothetical protein [Epibacterium sp.]
MNVKLRDRTIGIFIGSVSTFQAIVAPRHSADFRTGVAASGARRHHILDPRVLTEPRYKIKTRLCFFAWQFHLS